MVILLFLISVMNFIRSTMPRAASKARAIVLVEKAAKARTPTRTAYLTLRFSRYLSIRAHAMTVNIRHGMSEMMLLVSPA